MIAPQIMVEPVQSGVETTLNAPTVEAEEPATPDDPGESTEAAPEENLPPPVSTPKPPDPIPRKTYPKRSRKPMMEFELSETLYVVSVLLL